MYRDSLLINTGVLCGSLSILKLSTLPSVYATLTVNNASSSKHLRLNKKSFTLWHKRLGYISRQIMEGLIKDDILPDLDFSCFNTCVDCIKGKLTAKNMNAKVNDAPSCLGLFI